MAFEGKQSPGTVDGIGELSCTLTPLPESTEQPAKSSAMIESEAVSERERRQRVSTVPPPSRRPLHSQTAAFPGRAERRTFDAEKNSLPPPYARRLSSRPSVPARESAGYYSLRDELLEEVRIPRAPRVPLDFEEIAPELIPSAFIPQSELPRRGSMRPEKPHSETSATIPTPPPSFREPAAREGISRGEAWRLGTATETEDLRSTRSDTMRSTIPPPSRSQVTTRIPERGGEVQGPRFSQVPSSFDSPRFADAARSSEAPPRIYFSPHVRRQANDWADTGSLSIPGCSSPRHARALQRALLLALLTDPGWDALPQGLQQRAGWLFSEGWESNPSEGKAFREVDDLATILSLDASPQSRTTLSLAVAAVVPPSRQSRRVSEFPPPMGRR